MEQQTDQNSLFNSLVYTFYMTALQQLGKVPNPILQKAEINLDQAKMTIDMLMMLSNKTEGRLTNEEKSFLLQTLSQLQQLFLEQSKQNS